MGLSLTLVLLVGFLVAGALCGWLGARPPNPHRGPRLVPYRFLMVLCGAAALYLAAHLLTLFGLAHG